MAAYTGQQRNIEALGSTCAKRLSLQPEIVAQLLGHSAGEWNSSGIASSVFVPTPVVGLPSIWGRQLNSVVEVESGL
jgi:hypothetical protein